MSEVLCRECGQPFRRSGGRHIRCHPCYLLADRTWQQCHGQVARAVRRGELAPLTDADVPCVDCGERAVCYDHRDYSKPLDVDPVCRRCNLRRGPGENLVAAIASYTRSAA